MPTIITTCPLLPLPLLLNAAAAAVAAAAADHCRCCSRCTAAACCRRCTEERATEVGILSDAADLAECVRQDLAAAAREHGYRIECIA